MPTLRSLVRFVLACATVFAMGTLPAQADDIDIYSIPSTEGLRPNVLFLIDNTANWSAAITLSPGANTITVVAKDTLNNSGQQQTELVLGIFDRPFAGSGFPYAGRKSPAAVGIDVADGLFRSAGQHVLWR